MKNQKVALFKKEKNSVTKQKVIFQKSQKLLAEFEPPQKPAYSEHSIAIHSISMAGYVISVLGIVRAELCAREASSFCVFF